MSYEYNDTETIENIVIIDEWDDFSDLIYFTN